jgi:hypothetical protein
MSTPFTDVYDRFFSKITDDMYLELTPEDTIKDLRNLIINAIPGFEFPRKKLDYHLFSKISEEIKDNDYIINSETKEIECSEFESDLTSEEINILAILMVETWL